MRTGLARLVVLPLHLIGRRVRSGDGGGRRGGGGAGMELVPGERGCGHQQRAGEDRHDGYESAGLSHSFEPPRNGAE